MGIHVVPNGEKISNRRARHLLGMDYQKYGRGIVAYTPSERIIAHLLANASNYITRIATLETVMRVFRHNPETIIALSRGAWRDEPGNDPLGFWCHLPLNADGHDALFDGRLKTYDPDLRFVARQSERPAAIYHWCTYLVPAVAGGLSLVMERFTSEKFRNLPMYCCAANATADGLFKSLGFKQGAKHKNWVLPGLLSVELPDPAATRPVYDTYVAGAARGTKRCSVKVAHSVEDLMLAISIRGAAYVGGRFLPVYEDIDGNDVSATHLIGYVGDEPAGCLRIRYFADFVKFERLAVIPQHRGRLAFELVRAGIAFAQMKGYSRFYGQAAQPFLKLWKHFGFEQRAGDGLTYMTDEVYYEIDLATEASSERLTPHSGAAVLVRREGEWDRPGAYEAEPTT